MCIYEKHAQHETSNFLVSAQTFRKTTYRTFCEMCFTKAQKHLRLHSNEKISS